MSARAHAEEEYEMITEPVIVTDSLEIKPFSKDTIQNLKYILVTLSVKYFFLMKRIIFILLELKNIL